MSTECWAKDVSQCGEGLTGEHPFTRGLWPERMLKVEGLPRSSGPKEVSLESFVTKCLCRRHNTGLSELDDAAIDLNNALRRLEELRKVRRSLAKAPCHLVAFSVRARLLERWAFKTVLGAATMLHGVPENWRLPVWVPRAALGVERVPDSFRLRALVREGDPSNDEEFYGIEWLNRAATEFPEAAILSVRRRLRFLVTWVVPFEQVRVRGYDGERDSLQLKQFRLTSDERDLRLAINFDWSARTAPDPALLALRGRFAAPPRR